MSLAFKEPHVGFSFPFFFIIDLAITSYQWRLCGPLSQPGRSCF